MTSKQRVFSHLNDINYNDYIKNKIGTEVLKNIKSNKNNATINGFIIKKFSNHSDLINLTKTYYSYYNLDNYSLQATKDLYNSNNSYVDSKLYSSYNADNNVANCNNSYFYSNCIELPQVLYPYGMYYSQTTNPYFHLNLDLNKWCEKKNITNYHSLYNLDNMNTDGFNGCNENDSSCYSVASETSGTNENKQNSNSSNNKKCKTGLCKNAKPLFI